MNFYSVLMYKYKKVTIKIGHKEKVVLIKDTQNVIIRAKYELTEKDIKVWIDKNNTVDSKYEFVKINGSACNLKQANNILCNIPYTREEIVLREYSC